MFGKRTDPIPFDDNKKTILGLIWSLYPSDLSNLTAMKQLVEKGKEDISFGTSRNCSHGIFWLKLISMGLADEKPSGVNLEAEHLKDAPPEYMEGLKNLAAFSPTPEGKQILLELLHPALNTGWPPQNSIISPEAIQMLQKYADEGKGESQVKLAYLFEHGIGVEKNLPLAFKWHHSAAEIGSPISMDALAEMYFRGLGVKEDHNEAFKWFRMAADHGNRPALYKLGHIYTMLKDHTRAYIWYSLAVRSGVDNMEKERDKAAEGLTKEQFKAANLFISVWKPVPAVQTAAKALSVKSGQ